MASIKTYLNNIKDALYGKDVRASIHDGIDAINKEVEGTTKRQVDLESTFDELIINAGNSNAEIVDARVKSDGTSYSKLGDRLNEVDSQLEYNINEINEQLNTIKSDIDLLDKTKVDWINISSLGAKDDGTDCSDILQYAFNNYSVIYIPSSTYTIKKEVTINKTVSLIGSGHNSILKVSGKIKTDNDSTHRLSISNIRIENHRIEGNAIEVVKNNTSSPVNCLEINNVYFYTNNNISSSLTSTILYLSGVRECTISNCIFRGDSSTYGTGIKFESSSTQLTMNITIAGCNFYYIGKFIELNNTLSNMINLAGIRLINNMYIGGTYGVKASYVDYLQISDSMFDFVNSPVDCDTVSNLIVNNNYLQTQTGQCIKLVNNKNAELKNANISDNYMWSTKEGKVVNGIVLEGITEKIGFSMIKNNMYTGLNIALLLKNCSNCNINNNIGYNSSYFLNGENSILLNIFDNYADVNVNNLYLNKGASWIFNNNRWGVKRDNKRGRATFNGDGITTEFKIPYSIINSPLSVIVSMSHIDLLNIPFVANFTSSEIVVNFHTPPKVGVNNVVINYDIS